MNNALSTDNFKKLMYKAFCKKIGFQMTVKIDDKHSKICLKTRKNL